MSEDLLPLALTLFCLFGMYCAYLYGRHSKEFRWREYVALLAAPVTGCLGLAYFYGPKLILFFLVSCVVGLFLEYGIGKLYHKTLNRRLWTYSRLNIGGYTSWLTLPMWGIAGVVFWLLARIIGL